MKIIEKHSALTRQGFSMKDQNMNVIFGLGSGGGGGGGVGVVVVLNLNQQFQTTLRKNDRVSFILALIVRRKLCVRRKMR